MLYAIYVSKNKIISKIDLKNINCNNLIYINSSCIGINDENLCILINNSYNINTSIIGSFDFYIFKDSETNIEGFYDFQANIVIKNISKLFK